MQHVLDQISDMLMHNGDALYGGEAVTQKQHALQCATLAESEGSEPSLIAASLLHDIGHLLETEFESALERNEDLFHEDLGEAFLQKWFGDAVTQPVKLHVSAKRYLCATDPTYFSKLSPASIHTLELQGGPMSSDEVAAFEANRFYRDAVQLRIWDDLAKDTNAQTADVSHFMKYVEQSLKTNPET